MAPSAKKAKIDGGGDAPIPRVRSAEEEHGDSGSDRDGNGNGNGKKEAEPRGKKSPKASASPRSQGSTPSKKKKSSTGGGGFGDDIGDYCYEESSDYDDYHEDEYYDEYDEYYDDEYDEEEEDGKILSTSAAKMAAKTAVAASSPRKGKGASKSNGIHGHGSSAASHASARRYPSSSDYDDDEYDDEEVDGKMSSTSVAKTAAALASSLPRGKGAKKSNGTTNGYNGGVASKAKGAVAAAKAKAAAAPEEIYISSGDDYDGGYDLFSSRRCAEYDRKSHTNVEDHERIMTAAKAAKASSSPPSPLSPIPSRRRKGGAFFGGGGAGAAVDATASSATPTTREGRLAQRREHRAAMHRKMPDLEFLLTLDLEESYDNLADGDDGVMCYADEEEVAEEMAGVAATICRQTGVVVLRCGEKKRPASASTSAANRSSSKKGGGRDSKVKKGRRSSDAATGATRSGGTGKPKGGGGGSKCGEEVSSSSSSSSLPPSTEDDEDSSLNTEDFFAEPGHLFSQKMLDELTDGAREIEIEVCRRLDERHPGWRGGGELSSKVPSAGGGRNNNSKKTPPVVDFRYHEVALRGAGRIDIRYRMDRYPFNHPAVVKNHLILPIVRDMLNQDANLVYAGLILSFPDSSAQPWHMDGRTLFPELDRDVPPYALNVFVPLEDVSEELGPTELIPGSHTIDQAEVIDEAIVLSLTDGRGGSSMYQMTNVVAPLLQRGDALIYDYRVCHRGTGNLSPDRTRPMLYLMYARGWFKEHVNFGTERLFGQKHVTV